MENSHYYIVPIELLKASCDFDSFNNLHRVYWLRYGGQLGFCNYRKAFEYLIEDLIEYELPIRYTSYESFKTMKIRKR